MGSYSSSRQSPCHSSATPSPPNELNVGIRSIGGEYFNQGTAEFLSPSVSAEFLQSSIARSSIEEVPIIIEEPWNEQIETHIRGWLVQAEESQVSHRKAGYRLKKRYRVFTFIVLLWSAVILVTNGIAECSDDVADQVGRLIISALGVFINALFTSLNLGYAYREHFEYETKFFELAQDIECTLVRRREYRMPADAFMTEIRERRKKLALAPEIPGGRLVVC